MEILEERIITNEEAREILENRAKEGEMTYEQKKSLEILRKFKKIDEKKARQLFEELKKNKKLREFQIVQIVNLLPEDNDDLRTILQKDYSLLSEDEVKQILELVKKFKWRGDFVQKDEYAIVLDFLPRGKPTDRKAEPLAQVLGEDYFNLLEVVIKEGIFLKPKERIYIGPDKREKVKYIRGKIRYNQLTSLAKDTLNEVLEELVSKKEKQLVNFFNIAGPISTRLHSLEILPGIGKKHLWKIIEERKKKPFESFEDLKKRVEMMPNPKKVIIKRILEELEGKDRYRLIVGAPFLKSSWDLQHF